MRVDQFDFELPESLIALRPVSPRDSARLLVVPPDGALTDAHVTDLPAWLRPGDVLVINDTRVIRARLRAHRLPRPGAPGEGPKVELLLHSRQSPSHFAAFARPARKLIAGDRLELGEGLAAQVVSRGEGGEVEIAFSLAGADLDASIARLGEIPLPPYIEGKRKADARDDSDYQTMFAQHAGSVAAPTAALHFTPALVDALKTRGVGMESVTLHVGAGTFLPVTAEDTDAHRMHAEWAELTADTVARLNAARAADGRIVAVGTTALRTLESAAADGALKPFRGETRIFITPGYRFRAVDALLTNFHLPRSTLFMLVSAFMGADRMKAAYGHAMAEGYRFYSYGDACLLLGRA
jgi:S-adenosylmethionine:tRNA ribosyltransferase-isomerase